MSEQRNDGWEAIHRQRISYSKEFGYVVARATRYTTFGLVNPMQGLRSLLNASVELRNGLRLGWINARDEMEYLQSKALKAREEQRAKADAVAEAMRQELEQFDKIMSDQSAVAPG